MNRTKNIDKLLSILFITVIIIYLFSFIIINFKGLFIFFDSDMYADLVLSKYIMNQKSLFPSGWVFGNQYCIVQTPIISSFLQYIGIESILSIKIATLIMTLLIVGSFVWMLKPYISKTSILCGIMILFSSIIGCEIGKQLEGQLFFLGFSYYSCYLICMFLVFGCFARIYNNINIHWIFIIISLLLSFGCGMQSLRQTAIMIIPIILISFLFHNKKSLLYTFAATFTNILGILIIKIINPPTYVTYGGATLTSFNVWLERTIVSFDCLKKITGLRWLFKGNPIGLFSVLLIIVFVIVCISLLKNIKNENGIAILIILFIVSIFSVICASIFTNTNLRYIYLFMWYPLIALSSAYLINKNCILNNNNAIIISLLLSIFSLFNIYISYEKEIVESFKNENCLVQKQVADYINKNNYKYVYGEWISLGKYMFYVDEDIIGGSWFDEPFKIINYLNPQDIYTEEDNNKAVYLIENDYIEAALKEAKKQKIQLEKVAEFNNGEVLLYISNKQLMYFDK